MTAPQYLESLFGLAGKVAVVIGGTGELCGAMAEDNIHRGIEGNRDFHRYYLVN